MDFSLVANKVKITLSMECANKMVFLQGNQLPTRAQGSCYTWESESQVRFHVYIRALIYLSFFFGFEDNQMGSLISSKISTN